MLAVEVADGVAADTDRLRGVELVGHADDAVVECHRRVEDLEGGAHLVDPERRPVEVGVGRRLADVVGVEIGQRDHRQQLAGPAIHHQAGGADAVVLGHRPRQLLAQHVLQPDVDRQLDRLVAVAQHLVERLLDAAQPVIVDVGESHDMRDQRPLGIDAALLGLEVEAGDAQPVDRILLARRQVALQPDEGVVGAELGGELRLAELGQHLDQPLGRLRRVRDLVGVGVERRGCQAGREHHPVAVEDVGSLGRQHRRGGAGDARLCAVLHDGDGDQADGDHQEGDGEQRAGDQHPGAAGLDRAARVALQADHLVGVARAARGLAPEGGVEQGHWLLRMLASTAATSASSSGRDATDGAGATGRTAIGADGAGAAGGAAVGTDGAGAAGKAAIGTPSATSGAVAGTIVGSPGAAGGGAIRSGRSAKCASWAAVKGVSSR